MSQVEKFVCEVCEKELGAVTTDSKPYEQLCEKHIAQYHGKTVTPTEE